MTEKYVTIKQNHCDSHNFTPGKKYLVTAVSESLDRMKSHFKETLYLQNDQGFKVWLPKKFCES